MSRPINRGRAGPEPPSSRRHGGGAARHDGGGGRRPPSSHPEGGSRRQRQHHRPSRDEENERHSRRREGGGDKGGRGHQHHHQQQQQQSRKKEWRHPVDPRALSLETGFPTYANADIYETVDFGEYQFSKISPILTQFFMKTSRPGTVDEKKMRTGIGLLPTIDFDENGNEKMRGDIPSSKPEYIGRGREGGGRRDDDRYNADDFRRRGEDRYRDDDRGRRRRSDDRGYTSASSGSGRSYGSYDSAEGGGGGDDYDDMDSRSGSYTGSDRGDDYDERDDSRSNDNDDWDHHGDDSSEREKKQRTPEEIQRDEDFATQNANMMALQKRKYVADYKTLLYRCRQLRGFPWQPYDLPNPENESLTTLIETIHNLEEAKIRHEWVDKRSNWLYGAGVVMTTVNKMLGNSLLGLEPAETAGTESNTFMPKWAGSVAACQSDIDRLFEIKLEEKGSMAAMRDNPYVGIGTALAGTVGKLHAKNRWGVDWEHATDYFMKEGGTNQTAMNTPAPAAPAPPPTAAAATSTSAAPPPPTYGTNTTAPPKQPAPSPTTTTTMPNAPSHSRAAPNNYNSAASTSAAETTSGVPTYSPPQSQPPAPLPPSSISPHVNMPGFALVGDDAYSDQPLDYEEEALLEQMIEEEALKI